MKLQILLMGANIAHNVITNLLISFALCRHTLPSIAVPQCNDLLERKMPTFPTGCSYERRKAYNNRINTERNI